MLNPSPSSTFAGLPAGFSGVLAAVAASVIGALAVVGCVARPSAAPAADRSTATARGEHVPAPRPAFPASESSRVFVGNENDASITVLDAVTYRLVRTILPTDLPSTTAAQSGGRRVFTTTLSWGRLSVVDTASLEIVASLPIGPAPGAVTLTDDGQEAWIANRSENSISILDTRRLRLLGTFSTGVGPSGIAFSGDGRFAYVSHSGDRSVAVLELPSLRLVRRLEVGAEPQFLVRAPDGKIWGSNTAGDDVFVIDPAAAEVVRFVTVGQGPQQIAFGPYRDSTRPNAYVTVSSANRVSVIDGRQIAADIAVGDQPRGIWADPADNRVFVVHQGSNDLRVIDTATAEVIAQVPVGWKPTWVVVSR